MSGGVIEAQAAQDPAALPPCIVLGLETQIGLGVVRELGRAGVTVIGIAQDPHAIGLSSRHLARGLVVPEARSEALLRTIRALGEEFGPCCLLAISETNVAWLMKQHDQLGQVRAVLPDPTAWATVLDKARTLAVASEVGIEVPQTIEPRSAAELPAIAANFRFPGVMKWRDPAEVMHALETKGLPLLKAEYVNDATEFLAAASRYEAIGQWPLLQSYCAGRGLGQFFFMHQGQAVRRFQHLRVAEWPPEGGFSSVCDAVPLSRHAELQERSIALLQRIGWQGPAMVEYRLDESSGRAVLMEINGRFWGSFPLAVHCGAGFALLSYRACSGQGLPALPPAREDLRCRMVLTEIKRLVRILLQPGRIQDRHFVRRPAAELWRFLTDFLRPGVCYFVWDRRDPRPWFSDLGNMLRRLRG